MVNSFDYFYRGGILYFGNTVHYSKYHEFGTETIPKRPFIRPAIRKVKQRYNTGQI